MKDFKAPKQTKQKSSWDVNKILDTIVKFLVEIAGYILMAYGLRQMFAAMQEQLSVPLTIGIIVLMAYVKYKD